jgi:hypothetical protein
MAEITLNIADDKLQRLQALAQSRGTTIERLLDGMTTQMLVEFDAETRFKLRAARGAGQTERGLELLDKAASLGEPQSA